MKRVMFWILIAILTLSGIGLLLMTNTGMLTFGKPYLVRKSGELPPAQPIVAITHVNVIPMDEERIMVNQTVIVRDGIITEIGESDDIEFPTGADVIDGTGGYLMPGLADMHVHMRDENYLLLFLANGVTSLRDMWGHTGTMRLLGYPDQLALQEQIEGGDLLGPTIYSSGPVMEGSPPTMPLMPITGSAEEATRSVTWQADQGYQFVKIYDHLTPEVYQAILVAAQEHNLPAIGHVPEAVGLDAVLSSGQITIEHLTGYIDPDAAEFLIPEDQLEEYAEMTQEAGVWNCPTIGIYQKTVPPDQIEGLEQAPGMAYISPLNRALWRLFGSQMYKALSYQGSDYAGRIAEMNIRMTRALHDAGAGVILGTDTDNPFVVPGFSLHDELRYLVEAGFTPYEALRTGTFNAAASMGKLNEFGTVSVGKRADLLLLDANPLEDVDNAAKLRGVMVRGRWLPQAQLRNMLDELEQSFAPSLVDRIWPLSLIGLAVALIVRHVT